MPDFYNDDNGQDTGIDTQESFETLLGIREAPDKTPLQAKGQAGLPNQAQSLALLQKQLKDRDEQVRQLSEEMKKLQEQTQHFQKLKTVFTGSDSEDPETARVKELNHRFDLDPVSTMNEILSQRDEKILAEIKRGERKRTVREVLSEVDKEYSVDWDKNGQKIIETLDRFSDSFKERNLREAVISAIELTKTGEKRKTPPFMEGIGISPEAEAQRQRTKKEDFLKALKNFKQTQNPLRSFYEASS